MAAAPPGMVILDVDTIIGASVKQGRLMASGIDAKVFDPSAGGYMHSYTSPTIRNCQLLVATSDARAAAHVLSFDASAELHELKFGGPGDDWADEPRDQSRARRIGRIATALAASVLILPILISLGRIVMQVTGAL